MSPSLLCEWDGATTGRCNNINVSSLCIKRKKQQVNCCFGGGCASVRIGGRWLLHFPGRCTLMESISPVPVVGHEEQHLADAAEAIFQRGESQERQLGSAF